MDKLKIIPIEFSEDPEGFETIVSFLSVIDSGELSVEEVVEEMAREAGNFPQAFLTEAREVAELNDLPHLVEKINSYLK